MTVIKFWDLRPAARCMRLAYSARARPTRQRASDINAVCLSTNSMLVSRWDRLLIFGALNLAALALFVVCFTLLPILSLRPRKFAILYVYHFATTPRFSLQKKGGVQMVNLGTSPRHLQSSCSFPSSPRRRRCDCRHPSSAFDPVKVVVMRLLPSLP